MLLLMFMAMLVLMAVMGMRMAVIVGMGMGMGVLVVMSATGNVVVMNVHSVLSFVIFLSLYPQGAVLSKHLFLFKYPPSGLAKGAV